MTADSFSAATHQVIGHAEPTVSNLFHILFREEQRVAEMEESVTEASIAQMRQDIDAMERAIQAVNENNKAHENCIYGCSHILGTVVIRPEFAQSFVMRYHRDKFQRQSQLMDAKVEACRQKLAGKPRKVRAAPHMKDPLYCQIVQSYLDAEEKLVEEKQTAEIIEIDTEARAFALVDEISEYDLVTKRLRLEGPDFDPAAALAGIIGGESDSEDVISVDDD
jgi:hypothetical protein